MRTRIGKIARLPKWIRDQLNTRLENGEQGKKLVEWLNESDDVKEVLTQQFGGSLITENNLSEWKQGGYQDWLKYSAACDSVRDLAEQAGELADAVDGTAIGDKLANVLAVELMRVIQMSLAEDGNPEERWTRLQKLLQAVSRLRRDDHAAIRTAMKQKLSDLEFQMFLMKGRKIDPMFG